MRKDVHARRIEIAEPRRSRRLLTADEILGSREKFLVDRFHALGVERAGIFDRLLADTPKNGIYCRIILIGGLGLENAARPELRAEAGVLRIVGIFRLLFGIEVIEVAEEFVEAVHGRQMLVAISQVVLAELAGSIAERFHNIRD